MAGRLLSAGQRLASHKSWESLVAKPELASSRRSTDNLLLATLELINVPSGEDDLVLEQLCFGGGKPHKEVGGKRDWEGKKEKEKRKGRIIVSYLDTKTDWPQRTGSVYTYCHYRHMAMLSSLPTWQTWPF